MPAKQVIAPGADALGAGTWQNSTSDDESAYPSNVTRLARALQRSARVRCDDGTEEVVDQIVHYQQGVGTGVLDRWLAGKPARAMGHAYGHGS